MPAVMSAQLQQARQLEREGRHDEALALVRAAARDGEAHAQLLLGARLLGGEGVERKDGVRFISAAADQGHPAALHLSAVLIAAGFGVAQDWRLAMQRLGEAAEKGDPRARGQIDLLGAPAAFDLAAWLNAPAPHMAFARPRVGVIEEFVSAAVCDWIVASARQKRMQTAQVIVPETGGWRTDPARTGTGVYLNLLQADIVTRLIKARIAATLDLPVSHQEDTNILRYEVGQKFEQHCDFLDPAEPGYAAEAAAFGQRAATFLIYLNDDYDGGETAFPLLDWSYRGKKGDALFFWNVSEEGAVERRLLHAGRPPTRGEKWLFSQWVRDRPVEGIELKSLGAKDG